MSPADAIAAAERGFAVFPVQPNGKEPRKGLSWPSAATSDPATVARCRWRTGENYGVAAKNSGLVILDLDTHGELPEDWQLPGVNDGKDVFAWVCEWAGMDWPWTYTVATPSGGWHLYFRAPEGCAIGNHPLAPLIDVRGGGKSNGGYVLGPGSVINGRAYEVLYDEPVIELPRWIARLLTPPEPDSTSAPRGLTATGPGRLAAIVRTVEEAKPGERNNTLFWAACHVAGFAPHDMDQIATAAARAGLDDREISRTIHSARLRVGAL